MNYRLLVLLEKVLGKGRPTSGSNVAFFSPFCSHHKQKLEINLDTIGGKNPWHCWVSNEKGGTIHALFKKIKVSKEILNELNNCISTRYEYKQAESDETLHLPDEFKPLSKLTKSDINNYFLRCALEYLHSRRITPIDIRRYNIGVCLDGEYKNRIIVPSYNEVGILNYFVSRTFIKNEFIKYKNPKNSKKIIPFDMYINWNLPIYLVEGIFDAIAVRYNAIPLLGKSLPNTLKQKIVEQRPPCVYVALDSDAIKDSLYIAKTLVNTGINVHLVRLNEKDPSEMGHEKFFNRCNESNKFSIEEFIKMEIQL